MERTEVPREGGQAGPPRGASPGLSLSLAPNAWPAPTSRGLLPQAPRSISTGAPETLSVPLGTLAGEVSRVGSAGQV